MLGEMSGTRDGQPWPPRGSELDLPDEEAAILVRNKMALPVAVTHADVERAVLSNIEVEPREATAGPLTTETGPTRRRGRQQLSPDQS
jgi:hypothetical protein